MILKIATGTGFKFYGGKLAIRTNGDAYLLNDEGKTIDRI